MNFKSMLYSTTLALALTACSASSETNNPGGDPSPDVNSQPGVLQGTALDTKGKPIQGAKIWIRPALTTGLAETTTNSSGHYSAKVYPTIPYYAYAWHWVQYRGKELCLRLSPEKAGGDESFVPDQGAVRNFVWKIQGAMGHTGDGYFGGEVRPFFSGFSITGKTIEFHFVPAGSLVDGSTGSSFSRTFDPEVFFLQDIPIGAYNVSADIVESDGSHTPLKISAKSSSTGMGDTALLEFSSGSSSCVGSTGNGLERAFLWVDLPENQ